MDPVTPFVTELAFLGAGSPELSLFTQLISALSSKDYDKYIDFKKQIICLKRKPEFKSLYDQTVYLEERGNLEWKIILSFICQIICLVGSMDSDMEETKPESELISLIKKIIFLFNSKPDSESELVSLITQVMRLDVTVDMESDWELVSLIRKLVCLQPEERFKFLTMKIISTFKSMNWEPKKFISLCPQVEVELVRGKFCTPTKNVHLMKKKKKGECGFRSMQLFEYSCKDYFYCKDCNGEYHEEYEKALVGKHPIHPKHSLQLAFQQQSFGWRDCYCCDKSLFQIFYYCEPCDFAVNIDCMEKLPVLSINNPKRHEHSLALFPRWAFLNCNVCALPDASSPIYMCPPCDFVVHQKCLNLPRVIRISRHPHRILFTPSSDKGNWFCGVCRKEVDNDYGSYSCTNDGCFYVVHSRCATQKKVWDGIELEGVPEEIEEEEEFEPFVKIGDGIIQHFSHQQHHLRLDENTSKDYDDSRQCQVCIAPIYFGNFYSCMECEVVIHEECANLPRKAYHPTHPHLLTLVANYDPNNFISGICDLKKNVVISTYMCSAPQFLSH